MKTSQLLGFVFLSILAGQDSLIADSPIEEIRKAMTFHKPYLADSVERVDYHDSSAPLVHIITSQAIRSQRGIGVRQVLRNGDLVPLLEPHHLITRDGRTIRFVLADEKAPAGMGFRGSLFDYDYKTKDRISFLGATGSASGLAFGYLNSTEMTAANGVLGDAATAVADGSLFRAESNTRLGEFKGWFDPNNSWMMTKFELSLRGDAEWGGVSMTTFDVEQHLLRGEVNREQQQVIDGKAFIGAWTEESFLTIAGKQTHQSTRRGTVDKWDMNPSSDDLLLGLQVPAGMKITPANMPQIVFNWDGDWIKLSAERPPPNPLRLASGSGTARTFWIWIASVVASVLVVLFWSWRRIRETN